MEQYSSAWPAWASHVAKWVELTCSPENQSTTVGDLARNHGFELSKLSFQNPCNPALLVMALFLNVVYPFERAALEVLSEEDFVDFDLNGLGDKEPQRVFRNALCHGRFTILPGNLIEFHNKDRSGALQSMTATMPVRGSLLAVCIERTR